MSEGDAELAIFTSQDDWRGRPVQVSVVNLFGILGILSILIMVVITHPIGRIAGPLWVLLAFGLYAIYRRRHKLPIFRTVSRNWEAVTKQVLETAEEWQSLEEYEAALADRDRATTAS